MEPDNELYPQGGSLQLGAANVTQKSSNPAFKDLTETKCFELFF